IRHTEKLPCHVPRTATLREPFAGRKFGVGHRCYKKDDCKKHRPHHLIGTPSIGFTSGAYQSNRPCATSVTPIEGLSLRIRAASLWEKDSTRKRLSKEALRPQKQEDVHNDQQHLSHV